MKVNINTEFMEKDLKDTKSCKMYMAIIEELQKNDILSIDNENIKKEYPNIDFPDQQDLNIIFRKKDNEYMDSLEASNESLGIFVLREGEDILDSFNIVLFIDDKQMKELIEHEHFLDVEAGSSHPGLKEFHVISYLNTLTHELEHALEFMGNSGGLTPLKVYELDQDREFGYDLFSCSSGFGFIKYHEDFKELDEMALEENLSTFEISEDISMIVEDRVEANSRKKLESLDINFLAMYEEKEKKNKFEYNSLSI